MVRYASLLSSTAHRVLSNKVLWIGPLSSGRTICHSKKSHAELDEADALDIGDSVDLGNWCGKLNERVVAKFECV